MDLRPHLIFITAMLFLIQPTKSIDAVHKVINFNKIARAKSKLNNIGLNLTDSPTHSPTVSWLQREML